jgi:hypothetical protein
MHRLLKNRVGCSPINAAIGGSLVVHLRHFRSPPQSTFAIAFPKQQAPAALAAGAFGSNTRGGLKPFDFGADVVFRFAELLLESTEQFLFFAFCEGKVVVGELTVLLLQLAFDFVPVAFEVDSSHAPESWGRGGPDADEPRRF